MRFELEQRTGFFVEEKTYLLRVQRPVLLGGFMHARQLLVHRAIVDKNPEHELRD